MVQHFDSTESQSAAFSGDGAALLRDGYADGYSVPNFSYPQKALRPSAVPSTPHEEPVAETFHYRVVKRVMDLVLVLLAIPLLLPAFAVVALIIWFSCPGPVFFSHRRIRRNNSAFPMWKFRTMCVNSAEVLEHYLSCKPEAQAEWRLTHKLRNDPRITRMGTLLRQYSIDELPQLWNVLTGEMSLVGPRPIVDAEIEKYGVHFPCYCKVKPGITGLWQVSGRSHLSYEARVALDCEYVHRWSLLLDVKILLSTFSSVIKRYGAF